MFAIERVDDVIVVVTSGTIKASECRVIMQATHRAVLEQSPALVLTDAKRTVVSACDIAGILAEESRWRSVAYSVIAHALVVREEQGDFASMWESTQRSMGLDVKVFTSRVDAVLWLEERSQARLWSRLSGIAL